MLTSRAPRPPAYEPLDPEETPKGVALAALKEIEFDRETGKLSDVDYEFLKSKYTGQALEAILIMMIVYLSINLTVSLLEGKSGATRVVRAETFRGLSMFEADPNFVERVMNDEFSGSKLVSVEASGTDRAGRSSARGGGHRRPSR